MVVAVGGGLGGDGKESIYIGIYPPTNQSVFYSRMPLDAHFQSSLVHFYSADVLATWQ